jgi:SIR2-like domain
MISELSVTAPYPRLKELKSSFPSSERVTIELQINARRPDRFNGIQCHKMTSTDTTVEEFPGNYWVRSQLLDNLKSREATAFVGAGASMELYHGWSDLLIFLSQRVTSKGLADADDAEFWTLQQGTRPQQVARMISAKFGGDAFFQDTLREYFQAKKSPQTGGFYTRIQQLIASLPFKGIVTTNYDPGLLNALTARGPEYPGCSVATWHDRDIVDRWYTKDIFRDARTCPLLHIHGFWERPSTIILDNDKYRDVYGRDYFNTMFKSLWSQERLVLIGCGFNDTWLDRNLDEIMGQVAGTAQARHFAFIGVTAEEKKHVTRYRNLMLNMYRIEIMFYGIKTTLENGSVRSDHSELVSLLGDISAEVNPKAKPAPSKEDILSSLSFFNRDL